MYSAQTHDLKTNLIGSIARALAVFCIDEVVIFDDGCNDLYAKVQSPEHAEQDRKSGYTAFGDPNHFLYHTLSYLECPPHLRHALFGYHPNFRTASNLPSLDIPSHARRNEWCQYREGVTTNPPAQDDSFLVRAQQKKKPNTWANAGLSYPVPLSPSPPEPIPPNTRVTLRLPEVDPSPEYASITGEAIAPEAPRGEGGYYWGYVPRLAGSLTDVFTECPFEGGYDFSIGMSERGSPLKELVSRAFNANYDQEANGDEHDSAPGKWDHLLIVFGGPPGLEKAVKNDHTLSQKGVTEASELFDAWINLLDGQGSRTIRTEEAVWIGLMGCWDLIKARESYDDV